MPANEGLASTRIWGLAEGPDGAGGRYVYAGTYGQYVFRSSDNGEHWTQIKDGLTRQYCYTLAAYPNESGGSYLLIGDDEGVFISTNSGTLWKKASEGLVTKNVYSFGFVPAAAGKPYVFAGAWGGGVWKRPMSDMVTSADDALVNRPRAVVLAQNYPNPFNPSTTIHFEIPVEVHVALKVYNTLGQEIVVVVDEVKTAGTYDMRVDASALATGAYFYRLQAGDYIQTRKLLLIK
jgi:hypothetical protein